MSDRVKGALADFIAAVLPRPLDYLALYPSKVSAQNSDSTLELRPDDTRLGDHSMVPIRTGVPGMTVKVQAGARVLLGFENADPGRPIALIWDTASTVTELKVDAQVIKFNGGSTPVAKEGSGTTGHTHTIAGSAGPYPIVATIGTAQDTIASGQGSSSVKVP